jgi:hypothetical protein
VPGGEGAPAPSGSLPNAPGAVAVAGSGGGV